MMRRHDHFAALGPNRFALALTCCPASEARSAMRRLAELAKAHPAHAALRLGAACSPDHTFQAAKLLRFAEKGLDLATLGGEAAGLYRPGHGAEPASHEASFDWIAALNDRSLTLACRPVADAGSRAPALTQACASLAGPDGSLLPLGPVPSWDGANLALLVDGRMLELAADHLVRRPGERLLLPVSPATLQDPEWLPMLAAHLGARPGIESRLIVDIHEAALAGAATRGRLNAMKALGVAVALSGYGNGYASLAHLGTLPIDLLKIDGVFVQTLKRSTDDRLFVRTLIDRAHHFGIAVAAEWVDDEATARLLASWGVDYVEGACFGELQPALQPSLRQALQRARA
jgi:EAL domain-containing protein (putative c-di-GMP-specific phosphodiesterase class I)